MLSHFLANHSVLRERECILEGTRVQWTDRVFCDGTVYLSLDHTDRWTPHVPQALDLKDLLEKAEQQNTIARIRLGEACARLMRELRLSEEHLGELSRLITFAELVQPAQQIFNHVFSFVKFAFFFSFQTSFASIYDSSVHICGINGTNLSQPPSLQKIG